MKLLRSSEGIALVVVVMVMVMLLSIAGAGLLFSSISLKTAGNLKLATQALAVADAGLQHALALLAPGYDFDAQLNCATPPCTVVSETSFPSQPGFTYTVTAQNDGADINSGGSATHDTNNLIILNSRANGPGGTKKEVQAYVKRSLVSFTPPGALYLPASSATITFDGSTGFYISGNDTGYNGLPAANPKPAIIGVAPINDSVGDAFKSALGSSRYNLVQGAGYSAGPPVAPSVTTTTNVFDVNQIALNFYNRPNAVKYLNGLQISCTTSNPCLLGTDSSPQITYIREGSSHAHLDGYVTGSGVLITEGTSHLYGNFEFHGVVISVNLGLTGGTPSPPDDPDKLSIRNNAKVFGALLRGPTNQPQTFDMRNNARIYYSSQGLAAANNLCGYCFPQPARVFAWLDK